MRYYEQPLPDVDQLVRISSHFCEALSDIVAQVMVQVKQIQEMGAYVKLVRSCFACSWHRNDLLFPAHSWSTMV